MTDKKTILKSYINYLNFYYLFSYKIKNISIFFITYYFFN